MVEGLRVERGFDNENPYIDWHLDHDDDDDDDEQETSGTQPDDQEINHTTGFQPGGAFTPYRPGEPSLRRTNGNAQAS